MQPQNRTYVVVNDIAAAALSCTFTPPTPSPYRARGSRMSDDYLALNLNRGASVKVLAFKVRVISSFKVAFVSVFLVFPLPVALLGTWW